jgi:hypothetical protein
VFGEVYPQSRLEFKAELGSAFKCVIPVPPLSLIKAPFPSETRCNLLIPDNIKDTPPEPCMEPRMVRGLLS